MEEKSRPVCVTERVKIVLPGDPHRDFIDELGKDLRAASFSTETILPAFLNDCDIGRPLRAEALAVSTDLPACRGKG